MIEEGEESILHDKLVPAVLQNKFDGKRRCTLDEVAVACSIGEEGTSWNVLENAGERPVHARNVGVCTPVKRSKAKKFREDAEKGRQEGIQGQWQGETPAKEYLPPTMMKQAFLPLKGGDWEECKGVFRVQGKATEWALDRIQEVFRESGER